MTNIEDSHANICNVFMSNRSSLVASDGTTLILSTFFRLCPNVQQSFKDVTVLPFSRKIPFLRKFYCRKGKSKEDKKSMEI